MYQSVILAFKYLCENFEEVICLRGMYFTEPQQSNQGYHSSHPAESDNRRQSGLIPPRRPATVTSSHPET